MKTADLVIQAAVAPVAGQALDDRVQHLDTASAAGRLQPLQIGQRGLLECPKEEAEALLDLLLGQIAVFAAIPPRGVVLHVDDQQCRVLRVDLNLTAQLLHSAAAIPMLTVQAARPGSFQLVARHARGRVASAGATRFRHYCQRPSPGGSPFPATRRYGRSTARIMPCA